DGLPSTSTDPTGNVSTMTRDLRGLVLRARAPRVERGQPDLVSQFVYDRRGLLTDLRDPGGVVTHTSYDATARLTESTYAFGTPEASTTTLALDAAGRTRTTTLPDDSVITHAYLQGYLASLTAVHRTTGVARGTRSFTRDGLGRMTRGVATTPRATGTPDVVTTDLTWDSRGEPVDETTTFRGRALHTGYRRDSRALVRGIEYPDGSLVTRDVDALGRPQSVGFSGGATAEFSWRLGQLRGQLMRNPAGTLIHAADRTIDTLERTTGQRSFAASGQIGDERRLLDDSGRIRLETLQLSAPGFAPVARTRGALYGGAGWVDAVSEARSLGAAPATAPTTNLEVQAYLAAQLPAAVTTTLGRDDAGTLAGETRPGFTPYAATLSTRSHRISTYRVPFVAGDQTVTYDGLGRVTSDATNRAEWDAFGFQTSSEKVAMPGATHFDYVPDVAGRRIAKLGPTTQQRFGLAGWDVLTVDNGTAFTSRILYGAQYDQPLRVEPATLPPFNLGANLRGDTDKTIDDAGAVLEFAEYSPYGTRTLTNAAGSVCDEGTGATCPPISLPRDPWSGSPFGFGGQWQDLETGNYFSDHRTYSPRLRGFTGPDPLGFIDSFDLHAFAAGDPLNHTDPFGLSMQDGGMRDPGYDPGRGLFGDLGGHAHSIISGDEGFGTVSASYRPHAISDCRSTTGKGAAWCTDMVDQYGWFQGADPNLGVLERTIVEPWGKHVFRPLLHRVGAVANGIGRPLGLPDLVQPKDGWDILLMGAGSATIVVASGGAAAGGAVTGPELVLAGGGAAAVPAGTAAAAAGGGAIASTVALAKAGDDGGGSEDTDGSFDVSDWSGYPEGERPSGPLKKLEGEQYDAARKAANKENARLHRADPSLKGKQLHEVKPVKFGGSPTDPSNKVALSPEQHQKFTNWWNALLRSIERW
ncbi:MAG: RHS repeat-associated core domain-containing protein, partial [Deltaproteobacteria bacterium]|nr:RHS repeat-associated core domain-containing protein [Deltaproteobacteria bacterium]